MANTFNIEIKGLDKVQKIYAELPRKAQDSINQEFQAVGQEWTAAAVQDAPGNVGRLKGSISRVEGKLELQVVAQTEYAGYQEFGTKGQARIPGELSAYASQLQGQGSGGDPILALEAWVKRKGIVSSYTANKKPATAKSIAFLIFRKIQREGIKAQSFLFSSKQAPGTGDRMNLFINRIRTNVARSLSDLL